MQAPTSNGRYGRLSRRYWLIAGYGLRASRALLTLVVVIALATWLVWMAGFAGNQPRLVTTAIYALLSAVSVEGGTSHLTNDLSLVGDICRVGLRIRSPVLIGLALLSIRNRVKR